MADRILPTTVVGSYPQPEWLIDREMLRTMVPRVRVSGRPNSQMARAMR